MSVLTWKCDAKSMYWLRAQLLRSDVYARCKWSLCVTTGCVKDEMRDPMNSLQVVYTPGRETAARFVKG